MNRNNQNWENQMEEAEYRGYLPHDTIEEMEYQASKQKNDSNAGNVARAVLVVAFVGLICAIIDYYVEQI